MSYTLMIQKGMHPELYEQARLFANYFKMETEKHNGSYAKAFNTKGGWSSALRWGDHGMHWHGAKELRLRRVSKRRRIFAVVHKNTIVPEYNGCPCSKCFWAVNPRGCRQNKPFDFRDYEIFAEVEGEKNG